MKRKTSVNEPNEPQKRKTEQRERIGHLKVYGRASVRDLLGDFIVYRNLVPIDRRLPGLPQLRESLGLPADATPRKSSLEYARVMAQIIASAQKVRGEADPITHLIYIGDTQVSDGTAFSNLLVSGGWDGVAVITSETTGMPCIEEVRKDKGTLFLSNRWSALADVDRLCQKEKIPIDARTVVVIDIDKTAFGARGRNDHVIDAMRLQAMRSTFIDLLGEQFDEQLFRAGYGELNQPRFHSFTSDNQDYLAYTCLILQSGIIVQDDLIRAILNKRVECFGRFLSWVDRHLTLLPDELKQMHRRVRASVAQGKPTPFVEFRRNEYRITISRMGHLDDKTAVETLLAQEIVITHEVMEAALRWRDNGALLFGLSDKPDEASIPTGKLATQGYLPIHATDTHVIGG